MGLAWALCLSAMPAACSSESAGCTGEPDQAGRTVMLGLTAEILGQARTGETSALPDNEKMHTLRIVILHPDGTVEHNLFMDFGHGMLSEYTQVMEVQQNEKKTVCLIANEASVSPDLHAVLESYTTGTNDFLNAVDGLVFTPDYTLPLPMSSTYEVEIKNDARKEYRFYLVHAAAKFTFRFTNKREGAVTVNSIAVSDIAEKSYLMPHKIAPTMKFQQTAESAAEELYWIDWLKQVSDEAQQHPEDKELADKRGWIQDYDIPAGTHRQAVAEVPEGFRVEGLTYDMGVPEPGLATLPAFYLPESKNLKDASKPYGEQEYTLTLRLTDADNEEKVFSRPFGNLKALFRNTHVAVDIAFLEKEIQVEAIPYSEVVLNPEFGLQTRKKLSK